MSCKFSNNHPNHFGWRYFYTDYQIPPQQSYFINLKPFPNLIIFIRAGGAMEIDHFEQVKLLNLLENSIIGIVIHSKDTSVVYANPTALRMLRLSYSQIVGKDALDPQWKFVDENQKILPIDEYPVNRIINQSQTLQNQIVGVVDSKATETSWFSVNGYFEGDRTSEHGFAIISLVDITEKKTSFSFEDVVHNTQDIIIITEAENIDAPFGPRIVYVNKAFERITGYRPDEVIGETPRLLHRNRQKCTAQNQTGTGTAEIMQRDGTEFQQGWQTLLAGIEHHPTHQSFWRCDAFRRH